MEVRRFDAWTAGLVRRGPRRAITGGLLAMVGMLLGRERSTAACNPVGKKCRKDKQPLSAAQMPSRPRHLHAGAGSLHPAAWERRLQRRLMQLLYHDGGGQALREGGPAVLLLRPLHQEQRLRGERVRPRCLLREEHRGRVRLRTRQGFLRATLPNVIWKSLPR